MIYPSYANGPEAAIVNVSLLHFVEVNDKAVDGRLLVVVDPRPRAMVAPIPAVASIFTYRKFRSEIQIGNSVFVRIYDVWGGPMGPDYTSTAPKGCNTESWHFSVQTPLRRSCLCITGKVKA